MKEIALSQYHVDLGAKMVPFAGFSMPVQYSGVNEEHQIVRSGVGVFDVSHMGEFYLRGPRAIELLQKISVNDPSKLVNGKAQYSCMTNENGGIVDDLLIYKIADEEYLLVVNASNIEKDWNWIKKNNSFGVEMENVSDEMSLLAVQGPKATGVLQKLTDYDLSTISYYSFTVTNFAGIDNVIVSFTGYTGSGGFEIYAKNDVIADVWKKIFEAGKTEGIAPIGLAARDTLRLEMGFCLYGNDLDDTTTPLEAGLGWITKLKDRNFVAANLIRKQKEEGVKRKLVAFELVDKGIPRKDYEIADAAGELIGKVTSGTMSPSLNKAIGLGYVNVANAVLGNEVFIKIRNKAIKAEIVKLPFYKS